MTAAERKVRERYPNALESGTIPPITIFVFKGAGRTVLGYGKTASAAWKDAASRLPALENEQ